MSIELDHDRETTIASLNRLKASIKDPVWRGVTPASGSKAERIIVQFSATCVPYRDKLRELGHNIGDLFVSWADDTSTLRISLGSIAVEDCPPKSELMAEIMARHGIAKATALAQIDLWIAEANARFDEAAAELAAREARYLALSAMYGAYPE